MSRGFISMPALMRRLVFYGTLKQNNATGSTGKGKKFIEFLYKTEHTKADIAESAFIRAKQRQALLR